MNDHETAALELINQLMQELETIHKQALDALNAVFGQEHILKWKKQALGLLAEKVGAEHVKQLSKDWIETTYFVGDVFEELADDVDMCRRHLKKLAKEIETKGLPDDSPPETQPT